MGNSFKYVSNCFISSLFNSSFNFIFINLINFNVFSFISKFSKDITSLSKFSILFKTISTSSKVVFILSSFSSGSEKNVVYKLSAPNILLYILLNNKSTSIFSISSNF